MNPLEAPVHPGQQIGEGFDAGKVSLPLFQVQAEIADKHRNVVARWRKMGADLNIHGAEFSRPVGEQFARDAAVNVRNPFRTDVYRFRGRGEDFFQTLDDAQRQTFGNFAVGQRPGGGGDLPGGV